MTRNNIYTCIVTVFRIDLQSDWSIYFHNRKRLNLIQRNLLSTISWEDGEIVDVHTYIQHEPTYQTSLYLSLRCYRVTSLPWYQRKAAGLLGTLPNSSYEEAISYFEASETANPKVFTPNWLYLAKCHMGLKNWAEAKKWLTKILEEDNNPTDPDFIEVTFNLTSSIG